MKNNIKEKIQRIWGESLKYLKSLIRIFKRPAVVSVRTVPVESTVKVAQRSRIPSYLPLFATDSILSRICLVSLIWMLLMVGAFTTSVWGNTLTLSQSNIVTSGTNKGKVVVETTHAGFILSSTGGDIKSSDDSGFLVYDNFPKGNEKTSCVVLTWNKTTASGSYSIKVVGISFKVRANTSLSWGTANVYFNGTKENDNIRDGGVNGMSWSGPYGGTNASGYDKVEIGFKSSNGLADGTYDCHIKDFVITYEIIPGIPSLNTASTSVNVTIDPAAKQTVDISSFFSLANAPSDFEYEYGKSGGEWNGTGIFYATTAGTYTVNARIAAGTDHNASSSWSSNCTITVNRLTPTLTLSDTTGTVDLTSDVESPNYFDLLSLISTYVGNGRSYSVNSANSAYGYFSGDNFYATQAGDYTIRISSPQGDQYTGTFSDSETYREVTITVRDKARPSFAMNYLQSAADALLVEDTIENAFTFTNISNDANFTWNITPVINSINNGNGKVISYDKENNKIIAHNAGTATLQFVQTETGAIYGGSSAVYTFTVSKYETSFSGSAYNLMVDGTQTANYSYTNTSAAKPTANSADDFYYAVENVVFTNSEKNNGANFVTFNPNDKQITACNAGTGTITLRQKETYKFTGDTVSFNVAVYKYNSVFTGIANFNDVLVNDSVTSEYVLTYTKPEGAYVGENHEAGVPASEGAFRYAVAHEVQTENVVGSPDGNIVIAYDPSTKVATAKNKGVGTVTLTQDETYKYNGATTSFNVNVIKRTPVFTWNSGSAVYYYGAKIYDVFSTTGENAYSFSSSNPNSAEAIKGEKDTLIIKNVNESATITVTQIENYKWNGKSEPYEVTPVNQTNHVPFTFSETMLNNPSITQKVCNENTTISWIDNESHVGLESSETFDWDDKYIVIHFEGLPDSLSFTYRTNSGAVSNSALLHRQADWFVEESSDGLNYTRVWENLGGDKSNNTTGEPVARPLKQATRYIKLCYSGNYRGYFTNIKVTELQKFAPDTNTLDFGTYGAKYGEQEMLINFNHVNAGRVTRAEIVSGVGDYDKFSVSPTTIPGTGRDLNGTTTLGVTFDNADELGRETPYTATLRISDNNGHSKDVTLTGTRWGKTTPVITWNPHHMPYYVGAKIYTVATSTNTDYTHSPLRYETTDADVAEVIDGKLYLHDKKSPVTISVIQDSYGEFNGARLDTTFTPYDKPDLTTPLHLTKAVYDSRSITPSTDQIAWDNPSTNVIRIGNNKGPGGYGRKSFIITFGGVPDSLSFRYKTSTTYSTQSLAMNAPKWYIYESPDGTNDSWHQVWYKADNRDGWATIRLALRHDTRYVEFVYDGNYYGYFADINITALDGIKYMRNGDKYMSRGGGYGTQAVMDEFGVPVRVTRYTKDNDHTHDTTLVQFMDSKQYLFEEGSDLYTDNGDRTPIKWIQTVVGNTVQVRSANGSGKYITIIDGKLAMTATEGDATKWEVEDYTAHYDAVLKKLDAKAAAAAAVDFGPVMNTLAEVRRQIRDNDYEKAPVDIEHKNDKAYENGDSRPAEGIPTVYENIISVAPGFYRLTVKAMYKTAPDPVDWDNKNAGIESVVAYVFANDAYYPIKSRYDESGKYDAEISAGTSIQKGGKYYANDATSAHVAFADENAYLNDVYVYVEDEGEGTGTLRYGIKNPSFVQDGSWLAYENFTLTKIARKTYTFGEIGSGEDWDKLGNWKYKGDTATAMPTINHAVEIKRDITIAGELKAYSVTIEDDAQVTVAPNGGLTIGAGGVKRISTKKAAPTGKLVLEAATTGVNKGQTGYLRVSPEYEGEMPEVEVQLLRQGYSAAYNPNNFSSSGNMTWQYIGCPLEYTGLKVKSVVGGWINSWNEETGEWVNNKASLDVQPFVGFANSQSVNAAGALTRFNGQLVNHKTEYNIPLTINGDSEMKGWNLLANSFAAPIDIAAMFEDNSEENVEHAVYIFNTGSTSDVEGEAGTYTVVTKALAGTTVAEVKYQGVIPAMQGFFVKAKRNCNFTFNYTHAIWNATYADGSENTPMRVNRRSLNSGNSDKQVVSISMESNGSSDKVLLIETEDYSTEFENGYDAHYMPVGDFNIFAVEDQDYLAVDATNSIVGTRIGVRTGSEEAYTMTFSHVDSDNLVLWDIDAEEKVTISEGQTYTFFAEPNSMITGRFIILEAEAPQVATGIEETESGAKVHKFIKDDKLFILKNGMLYDATGRRVR